VSGGSRRNARQSAGELEAGGEHRNGAHHVGVSCTAIR
jgi:hypothetical protein